MFSKPSIRIAIIGVGQVGGSAAYALITASIACELLLVDTNIDLRDGQVRDLSDVAYSCNSPVHVRAANYEDARQCDIVVLTAGSKVTTGQTTIESTSRNISIVRSVLNVLTPFRPDTILLVVSNPVDLLTTLAYGWSHLPVSQVIGSGTLVDTARLRGLIAEKTAVDASSVDIQVLGVHGDSQVVAWSMATIGGVALDKSASPSSIDRAELADDCRNRSRTIMEAKGATPFGIGAIVASICSAILKDKRVVLPVSHFQDEFGCCFSLPAVLGRAGVISTIKMPLGEDEQAEIEESARALHGIVERFKTHQ